MNLLRHRLLPSSSVLWVLLFTLAGACLGSFAKAQGTTAQIVGKVVDQTGSVIPNVTIDVQNTGTGLGRTVTSSGSGEYVIPSLPVRSYSLKTVATGFKTYSQSGIILEGGQQARVDITLQIGSISETVQVSAQAVQVDTSSATLRTEVDAPRLKSCPSIRAIHCNS